MRSQHQLAVRDWRNVHSWCQFFSSSQECVYVCVTQTTHRRLRSNTVKSRFALSVRRENLGPPPQQLAQSVRQSVALEQLSRLFVSRPAGILLLLLLAEFVIYNIQCAVRHSSIENHLIVSAAAAIMVRAPFRT